DALAITADLDHLRSAIQCTIRLGMSGTRDDPSYPDLARELGVEGIGYVILLEIAGAPAGYIEETIIHRQIDIGDERRHRLERLEGRRQLIFGRRLGRNLYDLPDRPLAAVAVPGPDRSGEILEADHTIDEAVRLGRVMGGPQLEDKLVLGAEVDLLQVL